MLNEETRALLRTIHDETCATIPNHEIATKSYVAYRILQAASEGTISIEALREVAQNALLEPGL